MSIEVGESVAPGGSGQMTDAQGRDSIDRLRQVLDGIARDMIAKAGGLDKVGAHRITDAVVRRVFALTAGSGEGDRLGRAFVKAAVLCVCAEEELRRRFSEHPQERLYYERFWDKLT
jgi:hypothetical protein